MGKSSGSRPAANRDPHAPKRNLSAYLLYQHGMRETFQAQNPGLTFGELAKYTASMYAQLQPEEKQYWIDRAEADKHRYLRELAAYVPPPGYDNKGDCIAKKMDHVVKNAVAATHQTAPRRNLSAYLLYQNAMRETFQRENPAMTFGQLAKYTSHRYKLLSDEERGVWQQRAQDDKLRYQREMAHYQPTTGTTTTGGKKARKKRDPHAPKRARGSFVFFTFDCRPKILEEFPGIGFVELGHKLGERWRALSVEERKRYDEMAVNDRSRFQREMEAYNVQQNEKQQHLAAANADFKPNDLHRVEELVNALKPEDMGMVDHLHGAAAYAAAGFSAEAAFHHGDPYGAPTSTPDPTAYHHVAAQASDTAYHPTEPDPTAAYHTAPAPQANVYETVANPTASTTNNTTTADPTAYAPAPAATEGTAYAPAAPATEYTTATSEAAYNPNTSATQNTATTTPDPTYNPQTTPDPTAAYSSTTPDPTAGFSNADSALLAETYATNGVFSTNDLKQEEAAAESAFADAVGQSTSV